MLRDKNKQNMYIMIFGWDLCLRQKWTPNQQSSGKTNQRYAMLFSILLRRNYLKFECKKKIWMGT